MSLGTHFDTFFEGAKTIGFGAQMTGAKTIGLGAQRTENDSVAGAGAGPGNCFFPSRNHHPEPMGGVFWDPSADAPWACFWGLFLTALGTPGIIDVGRDFDAQFGVTF